MSGPIPAAEIRVIAPGHEPPLAGKELDWIYGDYLMTNEQLAVVIAAPLATRDANMTVRNIGGSILDLTLNDPSNDQLSVYTPAARRYLFHDPAEVEMGREGNAVYWQCRSSRALAKDGTTATVRYRLGDGDAYVDAKVRIEGLEASKVRAMDSVRADGWFSFGQANSTAYCSDSFFRQTIGFHVPESDQAPTWKQGRPCQLRYLDRHTERSERMVQWTVRLYPATSLIDLASAVDKPALSPRMQTFRVTTKRRPGKGVDSVNRATIAVRSADRQDRVEQLTDTLQTDDQGRAHARLVPGKYVAIASAIGCEDVEVTFDTRQIAGEVTLPLSAASGFEAQVTDDQGNPIPVKATIYAADGNHPDFGLSSTRTFVENCVYSVHGRFRCPLDPGEYEVHFSRGPEYNSVSKSLEVVPQQMQRIHIQLDRVVDTTGWVSTDLHSHSSPSGDNTSDQYGRVENLLCEHVRVRTLHRAQSDQ